MNCSFPNIIDKTEGKLAQVIEWARQSGAWRALRRRLFYLASYANGRGGLADRKVQGQGTRCILFRDFADYSFTFQIERLTDGEWRPWFWGGMIYSGPAQVNPSFTVSLTKTDGHRWGIHT